MADKLSIALAQLNPVVGDIDGNAAKARAARAAAAVQGADLVVFSELFLMGYPPEDLVLKPAFQDDAKAALERLASETGDGGPGLIVGTAWPDGNRLYNAAALLDGGEIETVRFKRHLPNYGVFDEYRVFDRGPMSGPVNYRGVKLGIMICEDMWETDVAECLSETGAEIFLVVNGSPFSMTSVERRMNHATARTGESGLPLIYLNQFGGQDELVFDGASFVLNADSELAVQLPAWRDALVVTEWTCTEDGWSCAAGPRASLKDGLEAVYAATMLGLSDYVDKNRFPGVILGLSGGIDSALSAAVAVDALGADRVRCVMMPSKFTSRESLEDAEACAKSLGAGYDIIPIGEAVKAFDGMLAAAFQGAAPDAAEENIQSRIRALIVMALSNKFGHMVLTTGNKSEMSTGYATLYGDMCGGYNALKDIYKTQVFDLASWRNRHHPEAALGPKGRVIPQRIIDKPPSAELKEGQRDDDSLPPYDRLDDILQCLVEREMSFDDIVARGHDSATVKRVEHLLYVAEYKRRQAPPGVKIGVKNFGRDRRYPMTNGFRDAR